MIRNAAFPLAGEIIRVILPLVLLVWLPLAILTQLDGWRMFMAWAEIGSDVALLVLFFGLLALLWAAIWSAPGLFFRVGGRRATLAWYGAILPVAFLILWSMARAGKHWIEAVGAGQLLAGDYRLAVALLLVGLLLALPWRMGAERLRHALAQRLATPFRLSLGLLAFCLLLALAQGMRPHRHGPQDTPLQPVARQNLPHVLLLTLDALSAPDMSLYGYSLDTTPELVRFGKSAHVFENFLANANFTTPATTSIETGKYPWTHGVFQLGGFLRGAMQDENLARELARLGYYNLSVTANPWASPLHRRTLKHYHRDTLPPIAGFPTGHAWKWNFAGRNFHYLLASLLPVELERRGETTPYPPAAVYRRAREMLAEAPAGHPVFLWAHIMPPHEPYLPAPQEQFRYLPERMLTRYQDFLPPGPYGAQQQPLIDRHRLRYDENIRYADREIGAFLAQLERDGWLRNAIVIIASDHGESFSHGYLGHAVPSLHQALIHVPLIIRLPGQHTGRRIHANAEQVDLLPTVLDLLGAPLPPWAEGESLKPLLDGAPPSGKARFSMYLAGNSIFAPVRTGILAMVEGDYKYVLDLERGTAALYQLVDDPEERHNLAAKQPQRAAEMRLRLEGELVRINANPGRHQPEGRT